MKILELKGYKSLKALTGFHTLLLTLKMLPMNMEIPYTTFYAAFNDKTDEEKETDLRLALSFMHLEQEEIESLVCFACDANDVPYTTANIKNLAMEEIFEIIVKVCMQIGKIKVSLVTEEEKKKFQTSALTSVEPTSSIQN